MASRGAQGGGNTAPQTHPRAFEALHEIAVAIGSVCDFEDMAAFVAERACALLGGDGAVVDVFDERAGLMRAVAVSGVPIGTPNSAAPLTAGIAGQTAQRREPLMIDDYRNWPHARPGAIERGVRSAVGVPLLMAERLVGVLIVYFLKHQDVDLARQHAQVLSRFAAQVAPALRSAELLAEHANLFERERRLREMSRSLASDLDEAHVLELATRYTSELLDAPYARLWLAEPDGVMRCVGAVGYSADKALGVRLPAHSFAGAALNEDSVSINDVSTDARWSDSSFAERTGLRPCLAVPFRLNGIALGALVAMRAGNAVFREDDERLLMGLADLVAVAIANARTLARLAESEQRLRAIFEAIACGILVQDADGVILHANSTAQEYFGYSLDQMRGKSSVDLWKVIGEDGIERPPTGRNVLIAARTGVASHNFTTCIVPPDNRRRWVQGNAVPIQALDGDVQVVSSFIDITQRKQAEEAVAHQARHDALTGLPNRALVGERLRQAISVAEASNSSVGLLLMDLDHFKEVNDTLGHHAGDVLLQQVARRLHAVVRDTDTVARLGGDEFAILLPATSADDSLHVARKLLEALNAPLQLEEQAVAIGGSIGIAMYPAHGSDPTTLLRRADVAMYVAKRSDASITLYSAAQDSYAPDRLALLPQLREAVDNPTDTNRLVLHYQPKLEVATGAVTGVEALVRWQHPQHGLLGPDRFVALAEHMGAGRALSMWVLETSLRRAQRWMSRGRLLPVAVNLSMRDVQDATLPETVSRLLRRFGLPGRALVIEITESMLMADAERVLDVLARLRAMGVRLSVDDFGTGYSSLAYLKRLPVNELKIDRMFVRDASTSGEDRAIVGSVVELAHSLRLEVVAEGVEDEITWQLLGGLGCDFAQGFHLARPMPAEKLEEWLERAPDLRRAA